MAANVLQQVVDGAKTAVTAASTAITNASAVTASKPIKLYSHPGGPNPWKVAIILNALNLPYETTFMDFGDLKKQPFESINPNGRVPAIEDPNTGLTLWESGAIIEYLLETYDKGNTLSYTTAKEKWESKCWLHFQMSGQGPYFGQMAWFVLYHPEKNLTSCLDRYRNEIRRVIGVLDAHLKTSGRPYLIGEKLTYADLAFIPWFWLVVDPPNVAGEELVKEFEEKTPTAWAWFKKVSAEAAVSKAHSERQTAMGKH